MLSHLHLKNILHSFQNTKIMLSFVQISLSILLISWKEDSLKIWFVEKLLKKTYFFPTAAFRPISMAPGSEDNSEAMSENFLFKQTSHSLELVGFFYIKKSKIFSDCFTCLTSWGQGACRRGRCCAQLPHQPAQVYIHQCQCFNMIGEEKLREQGWSMKITKIWRLSQLWPLWSS